DLKAKKGVPFFLEVARRGFHERFHFLLVGETDDELRAYLDAHQDLIVTILPSRDRYDLLPLYLACDFVAIPSHYDGFPNVLIESAALGIPCIASAVGGARDILRDGANAIVFPPGDQHDCRRAIAQAAKLDDAAIQAMGNAARASVRQQCSSEHEAEEYLRVLDETRSVVRAFKVH
ncbi:MAG: glycosyltransferase family 4 protein, partial [Acidobacteriota bacterium]